jgi:hypothetical protein
MVGVMLYVAGHGNPVPTVGITGNSYSPKALERLKHPWRLWARTSYWRKE